MNLRENALAILRYQNFDRMPVVHFGFWPETVVKWHQEGHVPAEYADCHYNDRTESYVAKELGFDFGWGCGYNGNLGLLPAIEPQILAELPNGQIKSLDGNGAIILTKPGITSIPTELGHLLADRLSWEEHFLPRLQLCEERFSAGSLAILADQSGRDAPIAIHCGSLFGTIRNWLGLEGSAYLLIDDEDLFDEIINTFADLQLRLTRIMLERGARPDYGHFWEDICCKSGPLISPAVFATKVGPWYRRFTDLLGQYGIDIVSLDCDGVIDKLLPVWLENGVNTMFPIEVGVWGSSIGPWRRQYGRALRGVGGMNKNVFALDYAAVDQEIERLLPLIDLGGYIACPDHRIPPTAKWENVQYYCDRLRQAAGG